MAIPMTGMVSQLLFEVSMPSPVLPATSVSARMPTEKMRNGSHRRSRMIW